MKLEFEEAIEVSRDLHTILSTVVLKEKCSVNVHAMMGLSKLKYIYNGKTSMKELKEDFLKKYPSADKSIMDVKMSKLSKYLKENGMVTIEKDKDDKRIALIAITSKGDKEVDKFITKAKEAWKEYND